MLRKIAYYSNAFDIQEFTDTTRGIMATEVNEIKENDFGNIQHKDAIAPIIVKAGQATDFIYKVTGIISEQADEINAIVTRTKIKDRISKIYELGGDIQYSGMETMKKSL